MTKLIDLTSKKFGRLFVTERLPSNGNTLWKCKCDCGNTTAVYSHDLKSGKVKSCGCYKREMSIKSQFKDLENIKFGRLVVLKEATPIYYNNSKHSRWLCLCDCGNRKIISASNLLLGRTTSCGCYRKERLSNNQIKSLVGNKYGLLTVLEIDNARDAIKTSRVMWKCACSCGNIVSISGKALKNGSTVSCGCTKESFISYELKKYLNSKYSCIFEYNVVRNPKTHRYLPYDIYIKDNIFIEVNGIQHYEKNYFNKKDSIRRNISEEEGFLYQKYKDDIKKQYAILNGIFIEVDLRYIKTVPEAIDFVEKRIRNF